MIIKWFPGNREPYHWVITMKRIILLLFAILCLALVAWSRFGEELGEVITVFSQLSQPEETVDPDSAAVQTVQAFAREQGLTLGDWPEDLLVLLDKNPETRLTATQVREHPWVKVANYVSGFDPNAADPYEEEELCE